MRNVLFVCSQNRLRSPTAEQVFSTRRDIKVASAGTNHDADNPLTPELVSWADLIFVMEKAHRAKLQKKFRSSLKGARIICLDIPDNYAFMDPELVRLLETRVTRYLG
ncbi:low molecular weight protein tyrosine phosphatase family protein [Mesorhizobium sp. ASY16-5R]|uniref:low molecular weight protein tyrosine phosphatase family protein n=1 Tax=Mesorhizobium sp. ASY16-5R TaxID=3445772 RepID=UPI003FA0ED8E